MNGNVVSIVLVTVDKNYFLLFKILLAGQQMKEEGNDQIIARINPSMSFPIIKVIGYVNNMFLT